MDFGSILELNREACALMRAGRYLDAANLLIASLQRMQEHQKVPDLTDCVLDRAVRHLQTQPVRIGLEEPDSSAYYLYNWAFDIQADKIDAPDGFLCESRVTAILLYNAGLCFHALGVTEGKEQLCFKKALRLYSLGLRLLDLGDVSDRLLHLALLDNVGFILASFHEHRGTQLCLEWLQYLLATAGTFEPPQREHVLQINMNVVLLLHNEQTHAGAA